MNIQKVLLRLYPRVWRARYEEEFLMVLASRPFSFFEGIDVIRGAFDVYLHPCLGTTAMPAYERMRQMLLNLRYSLLAIFCAYSGFIVAGIGFQKLTEDKEFVEAARAYNVVGLSFQLVVVGAVVALLAVLTGGLPIVAAVVKDARVRKRYSLVFLLATPILALAIFIGTILLLEVLMPLGTPIVSTLPFRCIFIGAFFSAAVLSTGSICAAVARSEISARLLHFAVLPSLLITLAMIMMLVATIVWGLSLHSSAPQLFNSNGGMFGTSTSGAWLGIVLVMASATVLATISLVRGLATRSALPPTVA